MIDALDLAAQRWLQLLADWSLRWGVLLLILWLWLTLRPPRTAAVRYLLLCLALAVGLALPLVPRWGSGWIAAPATGPQNPRIVRNTPGPHRDLPPDSTPPRPMTQQRPDPAPITAPTAAPGSHAVSPAPRSGRERLPETAVSAPCADGPCRTLGPRCSRVRDPASVRLDEPEGGAVGSPGGAVGSPSPSPGRPGTSSSRSAMRSACVAALASPFIATSLRPYWSAE